MILFGIAAIITALGILTFGTAALFRALNFRLKEPEHELSEEEKEALRASVEAQNAYTDTMKNLMRFGSEGGGLL